MYFPTNLGEFKQIKMCLVKHSSECKLIEKSFIGTIQA